MPSDFKQLQVLRIGVLLCLMLTIFSLSLRCFLIAMTPETVVHSTDVVEPNRAALPKEEPAREQVAYPTRIEEAFTTCQPGDGERHLSMGLIKSN